MKIISKILLVCSILIFTYINNTAASAAVPDIELGKNGSWGTDAQKVMALGEGESIPVDNSVKYEEYDAFQFNFAKLTDWYIAIFFVGEEAVSEIDLSEYLDGYLQMYVKADKENITLGTGFKSGLYEQGNEINALLDMKNITTEWQIVSIPIQKFIETYPDFQISKVNAFQIRGSNGYPGTIWVADPRVTMQKNGIDLTADEELEELNELITEAAEAPTAAPEVNSGISEEETQSEAPSDEAASGEAALSIDNESESGTAWIIYGIAGIMVIGLIGTAILLIRKKK